MRLWLLTLMLIGCVHHEREPDPTLNYIPVTIGRGVHTSGGSTFVGLPTTTTVMQDKVEFMRLYAQRCIKHCGVMIELRYDDTVSRAEIEQAIAMLVDGFNFGTPCYVRVTKDDTPRRVHLNAQVSVGSVELE